MSHIFISYSRQDIEHAQVIVNALAENGLDPWVDWKSIPKGEDWEQEIYRGIEEADAFIFLMSPDSVASEMCNKEIAHALENGKRILPIMIRDAKARNLLYKEAQVEIAKRNWIFYRVEVDDHDKVIGEICKTIRTDYEWLKFHAEFQVKANTWGLERDSSHLIRGRQLRDAESRLAGIGSSVDPQPTPLQRQYLLASQTYEKRQRQRITTGLALVVVILVVAAVFATWQWRRADAEANINKAQNLALSALNIKATDPDLALLLSVESVRRHRDSVTLNSLMIALSNRQEWIKTLDVADSPVTGLVFLPGGQLLSTSSKEGVYIWDWNTRKLIEGPLEETQGIQVELLEVDHANNYLIGAGNYSPVFLWDIEDYGLKRRIYVNGVSDLSSNPADGVLALSDHAGYIYIFDPRSEVLLDELVPENFPGWTWFQSLDFNPRSGHLISGAGDGYVYYWDLDKGTLAGEPFHAPGTQLHVAKVAFSPDGRLLATTFGGDRTIYFWEFSNNEYSLVWSVEGSQESSIYHLAFASDGSKLVSIDMEGDITVFGFDGNQAVEFSSYGNGLPATSLAVNSDGTVIAVGDARGKVHLINMSVIFNPPLSDIAIGNDDLTIIEFGLDNEHLIAGGDAGFLYLINILTGEIEKKIMAHADRISSLAVDPQGSYFATGGYDHYVRVWDARTGSMVLEVETGKLNGEGVGFSNAGEFFFLDNSNSIQVWEMSTLNLKRKLLLPDPIRENVEEIRLQDRGRSLAAGGCARYFGECLEGGFAIVDLDGKAAEEPVLTGHSNRVVDLAFASPGNLLATSAENDSIIIWDIRSRQVVSKVPYVISSSARDVVFSKDGELLITAYYDGIYFWDPNTGTQVGVPLNQSSPILIASSEPMKSYSPDDISLSFDGRLLASLNYDDAISIWNLDVAHWLSQACERAGRNLTTEEWNIYLEGDVYRSTCPDLINPAD